MHCLGCLIQTEIDQFVDLQHIEPSLNLDNHCCAVGGENLLKAFHCCWLFPTSLTITLQ